MSYPTEQILKEIDKSIDTFEEEERSAQQQLDFLGAAVNEDDNPHGKIAKLIDMARQEIRQLTFLKVLAHLRKLRVMVEGISAPWQMQSWREMEKSAQDCQGVETTGEHWVRGKIERLRSLSEEVTRAIDVNERKLDCILQEVDDGQGKGR